MTIDLNRSEPVIDYTSMDAEGVLTDMIAYARATFPDRWTDFNQGQLGWVFTKVVAYQFDMVSFSLNALLGETVLHGALLRQSRIDVAAMLDYRPPSAGSATVSIRMTVNPAGPFPFTISATTHRVSNGGTDDEVFFMPVSDVSVLSAPVSGYVDVPCVEGDLISSEALGNSSGLANQRFTLAETPMIDGTLQVFVNGVLWALAEHAVDQRSNDASYLVSRDEADNLTIIFGDGVNGRVPPVTQPITATYKVGGGTRGNLGNSTITTPTNVPAQITAVTNPVASSGGTNRPTDAAIARAAPAALHAHAGLINDLDIRDAALGVSGVAKAVAFTGDVLSRTVRLVVAPSGGGQPTTTLKNQIQSALRPNKMIGMRFSVEGPVYKDLELELIVYAAPGARRSDVRNLVTSLFTTLDGVGMLDFDQLDFGGVDPETGTPYFSETNIQKLFDTTGAFIQRVQIEKMTVAGGGRALKRNTGNGVVSSVSVHTNDNRRREYVIGFTSATTYTVKERIIGTITRIEASAIEDDSKDFAYESYDSTLVGRGYTTLNPNRAQSTTYTVVSNTGTRVETSAVGLDTLAGPGDEYYIERSLPSGVTGVPYIVQDPSTSLNIVDWIVTVGSSPFTTADELIVDTYPQQGDVVVRNDEYPQIDATDIVIRIVGGIAT